MRKGAFIPHHAEQRSTRPALHLDRTSQQRDKHFLELRQARIAKHKNGKQFFILLTHLQDMNKSIQIQPSPATHEIFNHLFRLTILLHILIIYLYLGKGANERYGIGREITVSIHISLLSFVYRGLVSSHRSL